MIGDRGTEAVKHLMHTDKVRAAHVPVRLLGNQREINEFNDDTIEHLDGGFLILIGHIITGVDQIG